MESSDASDLRASRRDDHRCLQARGRGGGAGGRRGSVPGNVDLIGQVTSARRADAWEGRVDAGADLPTDAQTAEPVEQGEGGLYDPAVPAQAAAVSGAASGDETRHDAQSSPDLNTLGVLRGAGLCPMCG